MTSARCDVAPATSLLRPRKQSLTASRANCKHVDAPSSTAYRRGCRCEGCRFDNSARYHARKGASSTRPRSTLAQKILSKARTVPDSGCVVWTGLTTPFGHGSMMIDGLRRIVHRVVMELQSGPIPSGMVVDHKCHNPPCINPEHLHVVTPRENMENRRGARSDNRTSGIRGVSWDSGRCKWVAQAESSGRRYFAGRFDSIEDAERAAIELRNEIHTNNLIDRKQLNA